YFTDGDIPTRHSIVYCNYTHNVMKSFKKYNGLNVTGNADKQTLDLIQALLSFNLGSKEIIQLKKDLKALGFGNFPANPSGTYGTITKNVVKDFQKYANLPQTGIADTKTLNKIKEVLNPPYKSGDRGIAITQLKKDLRQLGYGNFPANPSNVYGAVTANVVKSFQKDNGLNVTGNADKQTLDLIQALLSFNLSSKEIIQLKKDLKALGFGNFPANPSGTYGTITKNVVKDFQKHANLPQTGIRSEERRVGKERRYMNTLNH